MAFNPGTQVGPYRVLEQLGQGGMATVYKAYHASLDRYVAIKVLHQAFLEDSGFLARFQREARLVARLEHPNIVPIYDYAEHEGRPYLVMKYIEGDTLKARLQRGPLSASEVTHVMETVGAALSYAHRQGILHRDVKPSNVINANEGQIYLADFGLARIAQSGETSLTSDMILGTPQYMSPEQAMAKKDLDEGTDIYSFGVMLYEMTVGRVPFSADTPFSVIHDHIYTPLPLPSIVNPGISPALERLLLKALSKERADRFKDIASMVAAFKEAWTTSTSTLAFSAAPSAPERDPTTPVTASTPLTASRKPPAPPRPPAAPAANAQKSGAKRWVWFAAGLVSLCLCCMVSFFALRAYNDNITWLSLTPDFEVTFEPVFEETEIPFLGDHLDDDPTALSTMNLDQAQQLVDQNPSDPRAHLFYGFALLQDGQELAGYHEIHAGVALAGKNQALLLAAAKAFEEQEAWLAASIVYMQIAENARAMPPARIEAINKAIYYGFEESIAPEVLDYGTIGKVSQALSLVAQIRYNLNEGDDALAEALIDQLEVLHPDMAETKLLRAELLIAQDNQSEAKSLLQDLITASNISLWIKAEAEDLIFETE